MTQITFRELLRDPVYRAWFQRPPKRGLDRPWRVWVQLSEGGRWGKKDFAKYSKAYKWVVKNHKRFHDLALICPSRQFPPPILVVGHRWVNQKKDGQVLRVQVPIKEYWTKHHTPLEHVWCGVCRRPTISSFFRHHHALPGRRTIPYKLRCTVCGCSQSFQRYR